MRGLATAAPFVPGTPGLPRRRRSENVGTALRCIVALLGVIWFGTLGFMIVEHDWTLWKSLYFTLITITTVGYGDEGLSTSGQQFASVVLLFGIATTTYCMSSLIKITVSRQLAWKRKMDRRISHLHDHVIVCGFGRMGKTVCDHLTADGVPFVVLEQNEREFQEAIDRDYLAIHGNATEDVVLRKAGVHRARAVVCVVNSDAENVFVTLCARDFNKDAFIACRADTEGAVDKVERAGASLVVSPHYSAAVDVATAILRPNLAEFFRSGRRAHGDFELNEITIQGGSSLVGQTVAEFGKSEDSIVFVAVKRQDGETVIRPKGNMEFDAGDVVIVAGEPQTLLRMHHKAGGKKVPRASVVQA